MTIRLGYQIPNFTYPGSGPQELFGLVVQQAREAEAAGFDTVLVMDHFYQLPHHGTPDNPMLEAYTTLAALATATSTVQLSALVTGNTYRHPPVLAKTVTTLDVVSGGRAVLGIGAGWFELEHDDYGIEFGTFTERFEKLEESLQILGPMLRGENPTFAGRHYQVENAMNNPRVRESIPIMLGGGGEKKTFGLAARFADHLNIICGRDEIPRKLDALRQRCQEAGRDPGTLPTSHHGTVVLTDTEAEADRILAEQPPERRNVVVIGTPDRVAETLQAEVLDRGVTGLTISLPKQGYRGGTIEAVGKALAPLVS